MNCCYYMGCTLKGPLAEWGRWYKKLKDLAIGQSFNVETLADRKAVLNQARKMNIYIRSWKLDYGYQIQRISGCVLLRKLGHPKRNHYD